MASLEGNFGARRGDLPKVGLAARLPLGEIASLLTQGRKKPFERFFQHTARMAFKAQKGIIEGANPGQSLRPHFALRLNKATSTFNVVCFSRRRLCHRAPVVTGFAQLHAMCVYVQVTDELLAF